MNEQAECAVCHQPIPKGRVHYGGVSCYSCRAFFRRNTQRDELPVCKVESRCRITFLDRKQCSSCRYTKCIRIGMRPELVLNEEEKKRRFKKFLSKKEEDISNMLASPEAHYSDDESPHKRVNDMPPLEPIEANQKPSFRFSKEIPFSCPFQPTTSTTMYTPSMFSSKPMDTSSDWKQQSPNKSYSRPETDFLSELRSEVKNYIKKNQYEQPGTRTSSFPSTPRDYSTKSSSFPRSSESQKSKSCVPSPPPSPSEHLPLGFPNVMKDAEAWHYFARQGFYPGSILPQNTLTSPDRLRSYLVGPDQTKLFVKPFLGTIPRYPVKSELPSPTHQTLPEQRPSVITNHSAYSDSTCSNFDKNENNSFRIKLEKFDEEFEHKNNEKNLETTPISSAKVYLPENLSIAKEHKKDESDNDDLIFKYVHKKFRTSVENSEKVEEKPVETNINQKRKSVIFHASSSKRICVE